MGALSIMPRCKRGYYRGERTIPFPGHFLNMSSPTNGFCKTPGIVTPLRGRAAVLKARGAWPT